MAQSVRAIIVIPDRVRGYTLVEVLLSILIMLIIMLGLIQAMSIYLTHNTKVVLRNEAVKIAQNCLEDLRNQRNCPDQVSKTIRNFAVVFDINAPDWNTLAAGANQVTITVSYSYRGRNYSYRLDSVVYK